MLWPKPPVTVGPTMTITIAVLDMLRAIGPVPVSPPMFCQLSYIAVARKSRGDQTESDCYTVANDTSRRRRLVIGKRYSLSYCFGLRQRCELT